MNNFGVQLSHASVDRGDGADPRAQTRDILTRLRVPAGLLDADAAWGEPQQEAVVTIPVTDTGQVLTLTDDDAVDTTLTVQQLRDAFTAAGLTLWLQSGDGCCDDGCRDADAGVESGAVGTGDSEEPDALRGSLFDPASFDAPPVRISVFSHRGPFAGRIVAQLNGLHVDHVESGSWSLLRFLSEDPTSVGVATKAELPVIELNRVDGGGDWLEVTTNGGVHHFWPGAERHTVPVLDLDTITVPETAEICRRLLSDGDGSRDELAEVAVHSRVDVAGAHRALQPEALGGVVGANERHRAFLAAFGIPDDLIDAALEDETALAVQGFAPTGWPAVLRETMIDGVSAMTPLTRRDRPLARLLTAIRRRPMFGAALSVAEFALGLAASRSRGVGRVLGILMIVDAVIDLMIVSARLRRR